jgi:hypothetical protein
MTTLERMAVAISGERFPSKAGIFKASKALTAMRRPNQDIILSVQGDSVPYAEWAISAFIDAILDEHASGGKTWLGVS